MSEFVELTCPFCAESEFDAIGLKRHLLNGWCEPFEQTDPIVAEIVGAPYKADETKATPPTCPHGVVELGGVVCGRCMRDGGLI